MNRIENKIWSYYDVEKLRLKGGVSTSEYLNDTSVSKVRLSAGHKIKSFKELVENVALLAKKNNQYDIYFRGQRKDCKDKNGRTYVYPSICRPNRNANNSLKKRIRTNTIEKRYEELLKFSDYFRNNSSYKDSFYEYYFALIQHYELLPTPLIDITQSIRTAATFALDNSETGFFYIFGLPYAQGSISHFIDLNIVLVKLQSVCPENANRPHYQEGFLVGRLPFHPKKSAGDNLARRMIAKFYLDNTDGDFWDENFRPLPNDLIKPPDDEFKKIIDQYYDTFKALSI